METMYFKKRNIYFYDEIREAFEDLPSDALFVVDQNVYDLTPELAFFMKTKKVLKLNLDEGLKSLDTVEKIYDFLFQYQSTEALVAIGGGIIGDVALFAAATFKRGIPLIMVPTTLLSMVDSGVGGKSGVNYKGIKNYIGVFKNPEQVFIVPSFLKTLEVKELKCGMGELLKYVLLGDKGIQSQLIKGDSLTSLSYEELIKKALRFKIEVVEKDFRDETVRNILNLGHNTAHGLEAISKGVLTHGEAVALGLIVELAISEKMFNLPTSVRKNLIDLMQTYGLRTTFKIKDPNQLILAMEKDKKNDHTMRFTLLKTMGKPIIKIAVEKDNLRQALNEIME